MRDNYKSVVIFTDEDTDGMCCTRIIDNALERAYPQAKRTIMWQDWDTFGLKETDVYKILAEAPTTVFILDLGSGTDMLKYVTQLLDKGINVVLLDNHPPDVDVVSLEKHKEFVAMLEGMRAKYTGFYYESSDKTCTTAIAYNYAKGQGWSVENMEKWAIMGIEGDVAHDPIKTPEGYALFEELIQRHGSLKGLLATKAALGYDWSILAFYAQLFHNPRRMLLNKGPEACYPAMKEMEQFPSWIGLYEMVNKKKIDATILAGLPATKNLLALTVEYRDKKGEVEKRGNYTELDYGDYGVTIINHPWNIASALASKLSGRNHKSWFVINSMPGYGIHVSGRGGEDGKLHIGKVFSVAKPDIMQGGGLRPAGSAKTFTEDVEVVLDELVRCVEATRPPDPPLVPSLGKYLPSGVYIG